MHRSSDTIATIAAALAKVQVELINPEKSLVATIRSPFPREADRTFRYAPLSSGLDIVRKSLGRHEIATIQATDIDKDAGLLRLTTVLAHSSGEWFSSEWPVCHISDIASAQRVGAALTYARRYALFALVGIAGEDDLDAPDLGADPNFLPERPRPADDRRQSNGQDAAGQRAAPARGKRGPSARSVLREQLSASLRESLIEQMAAINSAAEAAAWAQKNLPAKNTLIAADAKIVEDQFRARLAAIGAPDGIGDAAPACGTPANLAPHELPHAVAEQNMMSRGTNTHPEASTRVKKQTRSDAVRSLERTVRLRDKDHRRYVLRQVASSAAAHPRIRITSPSHSLAHSGAE